MSPVAQIETFGHETFPWPGLPDEFNGYACARCWTGDPVGWPCTTAVVLGLVERKGGPR